MSGDDFKLGQAFVTWATQDHLPDVSVIGADLGPMPTEEKKPRLFYWEDAEDCWCPIDGNVISSLVDVEMLDDGEEHEIRFKRVDMTDEEFAAIPEG